MKTHLLEQRADKGVRADLYQNASFLSTAMAFASLNCGATMRDKHATGR